MSSSTAPVYTKVRALWCPASVLVVPCQCACGARPMCLWCPAYVLCGALPMCLWCPATLLPCTPLLVPLDTAHVCAAPVVRNVLAVRACVESRTQKRRKRRKKRGGAAQKRPGGSAGSHVGKGRRTALKRKPNKLKLLFQALASHRKVHAHCT